FWLIKDDNTEEEDTADFELLEERFLAYPDLALAQSHKVLNGMARKAQRNLHRAIILTENYTPEAFQVIREKEAMLDKYEDRLAVYIMQITGRDLNQLQMQETTKLLHTISDFERIGDHASGISKVAKEMAENNLVFSEDAQYELSILHRAVEEIISITIECFEEDNMQLARQVEPLRQVIRSLCHKLKNHHIARLQGSVCNINQGIVFNDMLNNLDRVAAHCSNVAVAVIEQTVETEINPHEYLRTIRETNENHFVHDFDAFKEKYTLKK
ncbi:MAG: Na/Pi cotransporter family protein, partial [Lachnospiraceae bacterium]|nr:Na/Pi cotransporter family protein [Lachnospiraceae bacterium]